MKAIRSGLLATLFLVLAADALAGTGRVIIVNRDAAGVGFNDPTPVAPVGGNEGTTIGQQRLNVFERAGKRWSGVLDMKVDIRVRASFASLTCTDTDVVLGQASAETWHLNFPNAPQRDVYYPAALANQIAGADLDPTTDEIFAQFNSALDNPTCRGEAGWYYGFDGDEDTDDALYTVVLHELGHGLGFVGGGYDLYLGKPTVFDTNIFDVTAGLRWNQMSSAQRLVSRTNTGKVVWAGPNATGRAPLYLEPVTTLTVTEPSAVARNYDIGTAGFGPAANRSPISGQMVAVADAANVEGPTTTDGCTAYSNTSAIAGRIALVDRGTCTFVLKALNAQAAGAIGVVIADNRRETCQPPSMGGSNDEIRIPVVSITQDDGAAMRAQLPTATVGATLRVDPSQRAGATSEGYVRLFAPCTYRGGSSTYHFDTSASPNLVMEPAINADLLDTVDLTVYLMMDIGWAQPPRTGRRTLRR
jgi:hypothetical protein